MFCLQFGELTVAVVCEHARLLSRLASYFAGFVNETDAEPSAFVEARVRTPAVPTIEFTPWDDRGKESFADIASGRVIRKERTGVLMTVEDGRWLIEGDLYRHFSQLVNLLGVVYGLSVLNRGGVMLHASAVTRGGRALAMIGRSGAGKSSTAVRLLELGCDFLSNDRVILEAKSDAVIAHGLPKLPRVNPGTLLMGAQTRDLLDGSKLRRYQQLAPEELRDVEDKYDLDVRSTLGRGWQLSAPLAGAIVLSWRPGAGDLTLQRLEPGQALEAMRGAAKGFGAFDRRLGERTDDALRVVAAVAPVYRAGGNFDPTRLAHEIDQRWGQLTAGQPWKR